MTVIPVNIVAEMLTGYGTRRHVLGTGSLDSSQHENPLYALRQISSVLREIADYWDAGLDAPQEETMTDRVSLGQVAYEAYTDFSGGKSLVTGEALPTWDDQTPERQEAWDVAAHAVARVATAADLKETTKTEDT